MSHVERNTSRWIEGREENYGTLIINISVEVNEALIDIYETPACRGKEYRQRLFEVQAEHTLYIFKQSIDDFFSRQCLMRVRRVNEIIAAKLRHELQLSYARGDEELRKNRYGGGRVQFTPVISHVRHLRHDASSSDRISAILIHRIHRIHAS